MHFGTRAAVAAAVIAAAGLTGVGPASAASERESNRSDLVCRDGGYYINWSVYWSDTTNHRISIDKVVLGSSYVKSTAGPIQLPFISPTKVTVRQGGTVLRTGQVPATYKRDDAIFYWPQGWRTAPSSNPLTVTITGTSYFGGISTPECTQTGTFWG